LRAPQAKNKGKGKAKAGSSGASGGPSTKAAAAAASGSSVKAASSGEAGTAVEDSSSSTLPPESAELSTVEHAVQAELPAAGSDNEADDDQAGSIDAAHGNHFAALRTVEDAEQAELPAAEADSETQPAGTTKKEQERQRKDRQIERKVTEAKEALENAMASMAEQGARCVLLRVTCVSACGALARARVL
jgi:hypothetical protein